MALRLVEHFVAGKVADASHLCEDILHQSPHFLSVIDGSSIKGKVFKDPVTGADKASGRLIAELIDTALRGVPADADMPTATRIINKKIRDAIGYVDNAAVMAAGPRPAASVLIYSQARDEFWAYGDTMLMMDGQNVDLTKRIDHVTSTARCTYVRARLIAGDTVEQLIQSTADMDLIQPLLAMQQACFLNNKAAGDLAYANIDGADEVIDLVRIIPACGAKTIVMGSDGYPVLLSTIAETEEELHRILREDPLMVHIYPQVKGLRGTNKTFDDRLYARLER